MVEWEHKVYLSDGTVLTGAEWDELVARGEFRHLREDFWVRNLLDQWTEIQRVEDGSNYHRRPSISVAGIGSKGS
jgi:hypothetical protein